VVYIKNSKIKTFYVKLLRISVYFVLVSFKTQHNTRARRWCATRRRLSCSGCAWVVGVIRRIFCCCYDRVVNGRLLQLVMFHLSSMPWYGW